MVDVLAAPTQKLDGPAPVAGPPLVDLSKLDTPKTAPAVAEKQAAPGDTAVLTSLQLTDTAQVAAAPVKAAENVAPAAVAPTVDAAAPAAKVADNQPTAVAAADCDKSTACTFTPTTDHEKSKAWWDARAQIVGTAPEKDPNCLYKVQFGDDLSTIAQRQLQAEGKAFNRDAIKAEEDKLIKLNDAQYKSLDCNRHYLQAGWRLKLTDDCAATPAPAPVEAAPAPQPAPPPVEALPPLPPPPPVDGQLPPLRPQDCDHSYNGAVGDGGYRREDHMYQTPGHHIILNFNNMRYQYEVPPGKSIIYDDNGRQRMITECNQDGSRPRHSEIIYRIDHEGRRHSVSPEEQQSYYQRFAPDYSLNYDRSRTNNGLPVQDRFSIEEHRVNEERKIRDEQLRRQAAEQLEAERQAAERHKLLLEQKGATNPTGAIVRPAPEVRAETAPALTPTQINALPTEAERTKARTEAMEKIRTQQAQEKQQKIEHAKQQEEQLQLQEQVKIKQEQDAQKLRDQQNAQHLHRIEAAPPAPPVAKPAPPVAKPTPAAAAARSVDVP